ncbi:hypothetical protein RRG08_054972 [Elysia crispata]|uniref:Uncharacterized protein n=1 Tax=Elysia crispata TaxID=231223 RepID=A0AAE1E3M7_9GAST|nr:hypothetical protein RRG08_054972 [Elysia crispata]
MIIESSRDIGLDPDQTPHKYLHSTIKFRNSQDKLSDDNKAHVWSRRGQSSNIKEVKPNPEPDTGLLISVFEAGNNSENTHTSSSATPTGLVRRRATSHSTRSCLAHPHRIVVPYQPHPLRVVVPYQPHPLRVDEGFSAPGFGGVVWNINLYKEKKLAMWIAVAAAAK